MRQSKKLAIDLFASDSFLVVNKKLLQLYDPNHAVLFSNLVDKYKYFKDKGKLEKSDGKEWFFLTYEKQQDQTGLSEYQVGRINSTLEKDGIIETDRKGVPAKKHYSINWDVLLEKIDRLEEPRTCSQKIKEQDTKKPGDKSPKNSGTIKDTKKGNYTKETKEKTTKKESSQSSSTGKLSAKERTKKYIPLAQYLAKVVRSHIDYDIDARRVKKWARDLRLLHEQNGVHPNRQKKVLKWYKKNIGGDYIPEAFSGSSFRDKFPKLEAAIKRQNSTSKSGSQPTNGYKAKTKQDYSDDETV